MLKAIVAFVLLVGLALIGVSTGGGGQRADFRAINGTDINTLDLHRMSWMSDLRVARLLAEGLVRNEVLTPGFDISGASAESWTVSDDRLTYEFRFRHDAKWSNGDPVTPEDYVFSWRRGMLPDTASKYINFFWLIDGAEAFYAWRTAGLAALAGDPFEGGETDRLTVVLDILEPKLSGAAAEQGSALRAVIEQTTAEAIGSDQLSGLSDLRAAWEALQAPGLALWDATLRRFDETVGVSIPEPDVLRVRLEKPTPYFLDICAFPILAPMHQPTLERFERVDPAMGRVLPGSGWTKPGVLVTNGPFKLEGWRFKRDVFLRANEHHWDRDSLAIETIRLLVVDDPNAAVLAFRSGAVDWIGEVSVSYRSDMLDAKHAFYEENADEIARLRAAGLSGFALDRALPDDPRNHIHAVPAFGSYFYNFNCNELLPDGRANPFADARVRRAFAMALDKRRIVDRVRRVGERIAGSVTPPGAVAGYEPPSGLPYDPPAARALLAEAGYPDGAGFPTVEITFNSSSGHDQIAQAIAEDWTSKLGVGVLLNQKELKVYRNDLKKQNFMVARAGWYADFGDPLTFLEINQSENGNNDRAFVNERYDALLEEASVERDAERRMALLAEAERILVEEELPLIPIFHYSTVYIFNAKRLGGISEHPRSQQNLYEVRVLDGGGGATP